MPILAKRGLNKVELVDMFMLQYDLKFTGYRLQVIWLPLGTSVCVVLTGPVTGFSVLGLHVVIPVTPVLIR